MTKRLSEHRTQASGFWSHAAYLLLLLLFAVTVTATRMVAFKSAVEASAPRPAASHRDSTASKDPDEPEASVVATYRERSSDRITASKGKALAEQEAAELAKLAERSSNDHDDANVNPDRNRAHRRAVRSAEDTAGWQYSQQSISVHRTYSQNFSSHQVWYVSGESEHSVVSGVEHTDLEGTVNRRQPIAEAAAAALTTARGLSTTGRHVSGTASEPLKRVISADYVVPDDDAQSTTTTFAASATAVAAQEEASNGRFGESYSYETEQFTVITTIVVTVEIDIYYLWTRFSGRIEEHLKLTADADLAESGHERPPSSAAHDVHVHQIGNVTCNYLESICEFEYTATRDGNLVPVDHLITAADSAAKDIIEPVGEKYAAYRGTKGKWELLSLRSLPVINEFHDNSHYVKAILGIVGAAAGIAIVIIVAVWLKERRRAKSSNIMKSRRDGEGRYRISVYINRAMDEERQTETRTEPLTN